MPELPEVETIARQLAPRLCGQTVSDLRIYDSKLKNGRLPDLRQRRIIDIRRAGKHLIIALAGKNGRQPELWLAIHLRMTGNLIYQNKKSSPEKKHLRAALVADKGRLLFYDMRRFGTLQISRTLSSMLPAGLEPLSDAFTTKRLAELLGDSKTPIKPWLLRQDRLVGLGNYLASEILFSARIRPQRQAASLSGAEIGRLKRATQKVVKRAIDHCGTTFSNYRDSDGEDGSFQNGLAVYGRKGKPCRRCRTPIVRIVQQQRSTFYCSVCQ